MIRTFLLHGLETPTGFENSHVYGFQSVMKEFIIPFIWSESGHNNDHMLYHNFLCSIIYPFSITLLSNSCIIFISQLFGGNPSG